MKDLIFIFILSATVATAGLLKDENNIQDTKGVTSTQKYLSFNKTSAIKPVIN
ncbi:MAG: hypothetical protein WC635_14110 [Bacteriovorax sp.]|jgi:hypothetical protein